MKKIFFVLIFVIFLLVINCSSDYNRTAKAEVLSSGNIIKVEDVHFLIKTGDTIFVSLWSKKWSMTNEFYKGDTTFTKENTSSTIVTIKKVKILKIMGE